ncbi:heterokaryon incompatibility protein-domain-containing protein [Phaeosphaeriaceae sp. PMI808]|nr:heterokaryon incompatibility protein-domain-containing protein [Phaeosphaeriaceae sp. PMI808]
MPTSVHSTEVNLTDLDGDYGYNILPSANSFRVAELLPGRDGDDIICKLHTAEWESTPEYEAISYAWGDPKVKAPVFCDGKTIEVNRSIHTALSHFRYEDRSLFIWADALCINQRDIPERGLQVKQMKRIYENAQRVQVWLGLDTEDHQAATAVKSIQVVSDFLCDKLGISIEKHTVGDDTYQELPLKNRAELPLPNETDFSTDTMWKSLVWFYSHPYFTRCHMNREINVGYAKTVWNRIDLVASYIIMEPAFSDAYGFSGAYCWWVATIAELLIQPTRWLNILYLASNYGCLDARDVIYGLRGIMELRKDGTLLDPDYNKLTLEVYRDTVEVALNNFKKADVLLYVAGNETPSWIPLWDIPMLFRNPFRFGKPMLWKPAGDTEPTWSIDKSANVLSLSGFVVDVIKHAESYNQLDFANGTIESEEGKAKLKNMWIQILHTFGASLGNVLPLAKSFLTAVAVSISFGLNRKINPSEKLELLQNFVAYLAIVLVDDQATLTTYISSELLEESKSADGPLLYPESSIFITKGEFVGCAIATIQPGDEVFIALGSTYPMVLRPNSISERKKYVIRGFAYVDGVMDGELAGSSSTTFQIQ